MSYANTAIITDEMINHALGEYERPKRAVAEVTCGCCKKDVEAEFAHRLPEEMGGLEVCPACMDLYKDEVMDEVYKKLDSGVKAEMLEWLLGQ